MISEDVFSPVIALLALATVAVTLMVLLLVESPSGAPVRELVFSHAQKGMAIVAAGAMLSSLYYSEVAHFTPCDFCWYQRIPMYSLAVLLWTAVVTREHIPSRYVAVLATIGLGLSIYHYQLQLFPDQAQVCTNSVVSCTAKYVNELGFISIPFMAGCGFLSILLLQVAEWRAEYAKRDGAETA